MVARVGVVVNPAAGRDIRRLVGGASVSDNYAKRRTAGCVLEGLTAPSEGVRVFVMPDRAGLGQRVVENAPDDLQVDCLEMEVEGTAEDTRTAAAKFARLADAVVVLGGDGTNRDVALEIGDVPVVSISTGTNNVVPTPVDGTVAGVAAALVATGAVSEEDVTYRHGMVEARVDGAAGERTIRGLATLGVLTRPFTGTRAILSASDVVGGVVSRAFPTEIGLSGVAGAVVTHRPEDTGGVGFRLATSGETSHVVRAITVPGVLERLNLRECRVLEADEEFGFELPVGVVSVDGERDLEVRDAVIQARPVDDGPRFVDIDAVFEAAAADGWFVE